MLISDDINPSLACKILFVLQKANQCKCNQREMVFNNVYKMHSNTCFAIHLYGVPCKVYHNLSKLVLT